MLTFLIVLLTLCPIFFPSSSSAQFHNGAQMTFGKNRVQYQEFLWSFYRFRQFDIYFYLGGKNIAVYTAKSAEKHLAELEKIMDYELDRRLQLVVFNKLSDLKQTNIGLMGEDQYNTGGVTRIVGTKIMVYFDGDHARLEHEIRAGIAQVLVNQMMYGGDLKDMFKSSTFLNLPEWYLNGLVSYLARGWDAETDNRVKDGIVSGRYRKFNRLTGEDAIFAGQSIWAYIADIYGQSVIPNILYMARISRNIESGFLFVLGSSLRNLSYDWLSYYTDRYVNSDKTRHLPENDLMTKAKKNRTYSRVRLSPDGRYAAFTTNRMGQYKVWLYDFGSGRKKKILRHGFRLEEYRVDPSYPLLAWHPAGEMLAMIREHKGKIKLGYYKPGQKRRKWDENVFLHFEKIADFAYAQDGRKFVLSAIRDGRSDIFVHTVSSHTNEQITDDGFDDLNPRFVRNSSAILFSSNRTDDTLRSSRDVELLPDNKDIFLYDFASRSSVLTRLTGTPDENEMHPMEFDSLYFTYLSDRNGIANRFLLNLDSVINHIDTVAHYRDVINAFPVTNYSRNILEQDVSPQSGKYGEVLFVNGRYAMYAGNIKDAAKREAYKAKAGGRREGDHLPPGSVTPADTSALEVEGNDYAGEEEETAVVPEVDINDYVFDSDTGAAEGTAAVQPPDTVRTADSTAAAQRPVFKLPIQRNYERTFFVDQLISQLDNSFTNPNYQAFTGGGAIYFIPGPNAMFKFGVSDVLEDYKITGGFRLAGNFNSNEYFMSYQNLKRRLDRQWIFHRQAFLTSAGFSSVKVHMHEVSHKLRWPFSEVLSARLSLIYRNDRSAFLSLDYASLREPNFSVSRGGLRAELIFDNTRDKGLNLYHGTRWKLFAEYFNDLDIMGSLRDRFIARLDPTPDHLFVAGVDYRHYLQVHREIILASRFAASTSLGSQQLIYYLGGVDNWLFPQFDRSIPIDFTRNYVFQAVATNMRGFVQGIRNGNSFALINSELRVPVFRYLISRPLKSDFLYNFQIVGFADIGTAWTGKTPYSEDNSLNTRTITQGPIRVTLTKEIEPIVAGYGGGLRARIWGYFLRTDWSWGYEDGAFTEPVFYLSMSLDF